MEGVKAIPAAVLVLSTAILAGCPSKDKESDTEPSSYCANPNLRETYKLRIGFDNTGASAKPIKLESMTQDGPLDAATIILCPNDKVTFFGPKALSFSVVFSAQGGGAPLGDMILTSGTNLVCWDVPTTNGNPLGTRCGMRQVTSARRVLPGEDDRDPGDPPPQYKYSLVGPCNAPECTWDPVIIVEK